MVAEDDPRLKFVQPAELSEPPDGPIDHLKNRWWLIHPTKGLVFSEGRFKGQHHPLCNRARDVTTLLRGLHYPWAQVNQIPSVFLPLGGR